MCKFHQSSVFNRAIKMFVGVRNFQYWFSPNSRFSKASHEIFIHLNVCPFLVLLFLLRSAVFTASVNCRAWFDCIVLRIKHPDGVVEETGMKVITVYAWQAIKCCCIIAFWYFLTCIEAYHSSFVRTLVNLRFKCRQAISKHLQVSGSVF